MKNILMFSLIRLIIDDYIYIFTTGRFEQKVLYIIVAIVSFLLIMFLLDLLLQFWIYLKDLFHKIKREFDKDYQLQKKAEKYERKKKSFEERELKKKEAERKRNEDRLKQEERQRANKEQEARKRAKAKELLAYSELNFSFFLPENGYPHGPSVMHRLALEEERIRRSENRILTDQERVNVRKGLSANGTPFGSAELQEVFNELWTSSPEARFIENQPNKLKAPTTISPNKKVIELHRR